MTWSSLMAQQGKDLALPPQRLRLPLRYVSNPQPGIFTGHGPAPTPPPQKECMT